MPDNNDSHRIKMVQEDEAEGEVAEMFDNIKREIQSPNVPNMIKMLATTPNTLKIQLGVFQAFMSNITLPMSLVAMIHFTVAEQSNCEYCAAGNELLCRTLGVDQQTLESLAKDLGNVNPERVRAIMQFALKVAKSPLEITDEDYDKVLSYGVSEGEIVEIIQVAAWAVYADIVADALRVPVEETIMKALPHRYEK